MVHPHKCCLYSLQCPLGNFMVLAQFCGGSSVSRHMCMRFHPCHRCNNTLGRKELMEEGPIWVHGCRVLVLDREGMVALPVAGESGESPLSRRVRRRVLTVDLLTGVRRQRLAILRTFSPPQPLHLPLFCLGLQTSGSCHLPSVNPFKTPAMCTCSPGRF